MKNSNSIALEKLALMLGAELGAGTVEGHEQETEKPHMFWTDWEDFRHLLTGYRPMEKLWRLDWTLDGFHCNTSVLARELPISLDDLREEFVKPIAAKMRKNIRKQREDAKKCKQMIVCPAEAMNGLEQCFEKSNGQETFASSVPGEYIAYTETRPGHFVAKNFTLGEQREADDADDRD